MSDATGAGARTWPTLVALLAGLGAGALAARGLVPGAPALTTAAETIGGLWVDALRMTVVPLLVALVVTSIAGAGGKSEPGALSLRAPSEPGAVSLRAVAVFGGLLALAGLICALVIPPFFVPEPGAAALRASAGLPALPQVAVPPVGDWFRALVPANVIAAAAEGRIVPLVLFALLFGAAARRVGADKRAVLVDFFGAVRAAMLRVIGWVLWLAPAGVFALMFAAAARDAGGLLSIGWRYVVAEVVACLVLVAALVVVVALARPRLLARFVAASAAPAMLAAASRSSIACLPAMVGAANRIGLDRDAAGTVLSLAVSLFKYTSAAGLAMIAAMAAFDGQVLTPAQIVAVSLIGMVNTLVIAGLPGQVSLMASTVPLAAAAGVPLTVLPLLLAIDSFADMARTVANVVADLAAAVLVSPVRTGERQA